MKNPLYIAAERYQKFIEDYERLVRKHGIMLRRAGSIECPYLVDFSEEQWEAQVMAFEEIRDLFIGSEEFDD